MSLGLRFVNFGCRVYYTHVTPHFQLDNTNGGGRGVKHTSMAQTYSYAPLVEGVSFEAPLAGDLERFITFLRLQVPPALSFKRKQG